MNDHDRELLSRFIDGELTSAQEEEVAKKLMASAEYREELEKLKSLHTLSQEVYPVQEFRYKKPAKRRLPRLAPLAAALALTCILAGVGYAALSGALFGQDEETSEMTQVDSSVAEDDLEPAENSETGIVTEPQADETPEEVEAQEKSTTVAVSAPRIITGTVHDYDGHPIQGARVVTPDLETSTDRNGAFSIPFPDGFFHEVVVVKSGYSNVRFRVQPYLIDAEIDLKVKLNPKVNVQGRVVDEFDRPVSGARVTAYRDTKNPETAISDEDGRYTLGVSSTDASWLWIEHMDFAATTGVIQTDGRVADVVLKEGETLRVSVLEKGTPIEGIRVLVKKLEKERFKELTAYTDSNGYAWFNQLPNDQEYAVRAIKPDGDEEHQWVRVVKNQQAECTVNFDREFVATLSGRVMGADGNPIGDARITVVADDSPERGRAAHTDEEGRYTLSLNPGRNRVVVNIEQQWKQRLVNTSLRIIDAGSGEGEFKQNFRFEAVEPASVGLVAVNGDPVDSVLLRSETLVNDYYDSVRAWLRLPDGTLSAWSGAQRLEAFDPVTGMVNEERKYTDGQSANEDFPVRIILDQPAGAIVGRVITPSGNPVSGARIYARTDSSAAFWLGGTYTDSDGKFRLEPLRMNDEYRLWTERLGYIRETSLTTAKPGNESNPVVVTMYLPDSEISGRVVYPNGQPVAEAAISLQPGLHFGGAYGRADARGNFRLNVRRGIYSMEAEGQGVSSGVLSVQAPASNMQVVMPYPEGAINDPFHQLRNNNLKQLGLSFKMYSNESRGERYPNLSMTVGAFLPVLSQIYPEYAPDQAILQAMRGEGGFPRMIYFGYAIMDSEVANLFLDAYEDYGPAEISGSDLATEPGMGSSGGDSIFLLREGIHRFFITDINDPNASARAQSDIPVLWELPDLARESGGWVLYLDGHTEYVEYPGKYPMDEYVIERVRGMIDGGLLTR